MVSPDDFQFAMENTRVVVSPDQRIETFGTTTFRFLLVSELMDEAHRVRVRDGRIQAERPRILAPHYLQKMLIEGFGDQAREFASWLEDNPDMIRILRYGFQLRKTDVSEEILAEPLQSVLGRLEDKVRADSDTLTVLIEGVDDAWEVCLLKFTVDLIRQSAGENMDEWKRRGLI